MKNGLKTIIQNHDPANLYLAAGFIADGILHS